MMFSRKFCVLLSPSNVRQSHQHYHHAWFRTAARIPSIPFAFETVPLGSNSFLCQLDHVIATLCNEDFMLLCIDHPKSETIEIRGRKLEEAKRHDSGRRRRIGSSQKISFAYRTACVRACRPASTQVSNQAIRNFQHLTIFYLHLIDSVPFSNISKKVDPIPV